MDRIRTFLRSSHGVAIIDYAAVAGLVTTMGQIAMRHGSAIAGTVRGVIGA